MIYDSVGKKLGRYTEDADKFTIEFQTLALGFDLSWRNIQFLLADCCTSTEMENFVAVVNGDVNEAFARDPIS
jgi:hypothetical protein